MINTDYDSDLLAQLTQIVRLRDAELGAPYVRAKAAYYLKPPSKNNNEQLESFLAGAEFDDYTIQTSSAMIGQLKLNEVELVTPSSTLDYLNGDIDGDGLSLNGALENVANELLLVKWQIAVVDYNGLTDIPIEQVSKAEYQQANPRPVVKFYSRESVVKRHFESINGKKQLSYIMLAEHGSSFDKNTGEHTAIESYLILALDEDGHYYQQKIVKGDGENIEGERDYISINGQMLEYIPAIIISDEEVEAELPKNFGFLSPIADICFWRYQKSAYYSYFLEKLLPTTDIMVGRDFDMDEFENLNGRNYYAHGSTNFIPSENTDINKEGAQGQIQEIRQALIDSAEKAKTLGAVIPENTDASKTATEAVLIAGKQNSVLRPLVNQLENSFKWVIGYCAVFAGVTQQENIAEYVNSIELELPRKFTEPTLDPQQVNAVLSIYTAGLTTKERAIKRLIHLGYEEGTAEDVLNELEMQGL